MISGLVLTGFTLGPFIWNELFYLLVNPNNVKAIKNEETGESYFPKEVSDKVFFTINTV